MADKTEKKPIYLASNQAEVDERSRGMEAVSRFFENSKISKKVNNLSGWQKFRLKIWYKYNKTKYSKFGAVYFATGDAFKAYNEARTYKKKAKE